MGDIKAGLQRYKFEKRSMACPRYARCALEMNDVHDADQK